MRAMQPMWYFDRLTIMLLSNSSPVMGRPRGLFTTDMLHFDAFTPDALPYALHKSSYECNIKGISTRKQRTQGKAAVLKFIFHDDSVLGF